MTSWLIPANIKFYDVFAALALKETYWPKNAKVNAGDTLYIYLATPHKQIGYICEVLETQHDLLDIYDQVAPFVKNQEDEAPTSRPFMKIKPMQAIELDKESALTLDRLRDNGLKGMLMGARKLDNNPELFAYIKGIIA